MFSEDEIDEFLKRWQALKKEMADLEKQNEKYKKIAAQVIDQNDSSKINATHYSLTRRIMSREVLIKGDVPVDIWNRYAKRISYPAFYISKKTTKKKAVSC